MGGAHFKTRAPGCAYNFFALLVLGMLALSMHITFSRCWCLACWHSLFRRKPTRREVKARTVVGRGEKSLLCGPGSQLRLRGGRDKRRAKIINEMKKISLKKNKNAKGQKPKGYPLKQGCLTRVTRTYGRLRTSTRRSPNSCRCWRKN